MELNLLETYTLARILDKHKPEGTFFKDRYFPTGANDIFKSDKVLTEYRKHDRKMAAFVSTHIGDIPVEREGYEIHEYEPANIGVSRVMTIDDLQKRGFGEALYSNSTPAQRAARLLLDDMAELDRRITRREEWMVVQTMINNACTIQEYIDAKTVGKERLIKFYEGTSDHTYTVANMWNSEKGNFYKDVAAMAKILVDNGLDASDLILGSDAAEVVYDDEKLRTLLDASLKINIGSIDERPYAAGVTFMGTLNFRSIKLNLFDVSESYEDDDGVTQRYFPSTSAMVTAPKCGHLMYGQITQIPYGSRDYETLARKRIPKFMIEDNVRKLRLSARPLAAPINYCPYIYAANVVS